MEIEAVSGIDVSAADYFCSHRWRYAVASEPSALNPFLDHTLGIASTGDWCTISRIEDAWLNAMKLVDAILYSD